MYIKDAEEKKIIIAYCKCYSNKMEKDLLCNSSVHAAWLIRWREDFAINGRCLQMWHQKFVESATKHKKGVEPPDYYMEYNQFINAVTDWINVNYDKNLRRKRNKNRYADILTEYRRACIDKLERLLKDSIYLIMSWSMCFHKRQMRCSRSWYNIHLLMMV